MLPLYKQNCDNIVTLKGVLPMTHVGLAYLDAFRLIKVILQVAASKPYGDLTSNHSYKYYRL